MFGLLAFESLVFGLLVFESLVFGLLAFESSVFGLLAFESLVFGLLAFESLVFGLLVFESLVFGLLVFELLVFGLLVFELDTDESPLLPPLVPSATAPTPINPSATKLAFVAVGNPAVVCVAVATGDAIVGATDATSAAETAGTTGMAALPVANVVFMLIRTSGSLTDCVLA